MIPEGGASPRNTSNGAVLHDTSAVPGYHEKEVDTVPSEDGTVPREDGEKKDAALLKDGTSPGDDSEEITEDEDDVPRENEEVWLTTPTSCTDI